MNLLRRDKKVDIDYLVDEVLKKDQPVDLNRLRTTNSQLHVVVTNAMTGRKEVLSAFDDLVELYEEFRATAALPLLYDKNVQIGQKWFVDGGVADLIPVDVAHQLGCTDIVIVMTQQIASYRFNRHHTRLIKHLVRHFAKGKPQPLRKILPTNEKLLKANLRQLSHPLKTVRVYVLEPSDEEILISLATTDKPKVKALAELGVKDMDSLLNREIVQKVR
ncbi:MAG TPA: patatin-like phospholipase family protein [Candidatus Saccharimonadales bacterium]|nr:patatin-like phospholipase family protein [Candidatus Saccharimonadales bacterium]